MKTFAFLSCVQIWLLVPHRLGGEFMWAGSCWIGAWQIMFLWIWLSTHFLSTWEAGTGPSMCQQPGTRKTSTSNCGWIWMASQYHQEERSTTSITTGGITEVPTWNCCSGAGSWLSRLWDSLALEDVHVLQDPKWRKKTLRRRFLSVLFLACLHILCPLRNAIAPPKTMSLKSSSWTLTLKQGMCGVGSSIDFPKPEIQGLNYYNWGLRCVNHSKTITVKDQECLKQKMTSVYLNPVAGLHWRMGRN